MSAAGAQYGRDYEKWRLLIEKAGDVGAKLGHAETGPVKQRDPATIERLRAELRTIHAERKELSVRHGWQISLNGS